MAEPFLLLLGVTSGVLFLSLYGALKDQWLLSEINKSRDLNSLVTIRLFGVREYPDSLSCNTVLLYIPWLVVGALQGLIHATSLINEAFENSFPEVGEWNLTTALFLVCMSWDVLIISGVILIQLGATLEPVYLVGEVWKEFGIYLRTAGGALLAWTLAQPFIREHKDILKLNKR